MEEIDLNLLVVLDALLEDCSVTAAAHRLQRSMPTVSRSLTRLREALDDPILVRSGNKLIPTPRALELRGRVHELVLEARILAAPHDPVDISNVRRVFTIATSDAVMCYVGSELVSLLTRSAPGIRVSFVMSGPVELSLRDTAVDMEVGIVRHHQPETHVEALMHDRLVGIARKDHPIFDHDITLEVYAGFSHLLHSRIGTLWTDIDDRLAMRSSNREIAASAPTVASSLVILTRTDLVGTCLERLTMPLAAELGLRYFELPIETRPATISLAWHPRFDKDPVHSWLRDRLTEILHNVDDSAAALLERA